MFCPIGTCSKGHTTWWWRSPTLNGATKLYFTHYSCVVITFYEIGLLKSINQYLEISFPSFCVLHVFIFFKFSNSMSYKIIVYKKEPHSSTLDVRALAEKTRCTIESGGTLAKLGDLLKTCFVAWYTEVFRIIIKKSNSEHHCEIRHSGEDLPNFLGY